MKMKNKVILVVTLALIVSLTLTACSSEQNKFKIGYVPVAGNVLYYIADDLGYFAEEGMDVKMKSFKNDQKGLEALMADKINTGAFATSDQLCVE